jgi:hypothetical protein
MNPNLEKPQNEITEPKNIERVEKVPMKVTDLRNNPEDAFDLNKFLEMIARLRSEGLHAISREFTDSDYGKYMSIPGSSESDHWDDAIQNAQAVEITVSNPPNRGHDFLKAKTEVEVKVLMNGAEGRVFTFRFTDGKYSNAGWDDVHLQRTIDGDNPLEFALTIKPKELK